MPLETTNISLTDWAGNLISGSTALPVVGTIADAGPMVPSVQLGVPIIGQSSGVGRILAVNRFGIAVPGYQTLLACDPVEGSVINTVNWTTGSVTMGISQATGLLTLNSAATTVTTTYALLTSNRQFPIVNQSPVAMSVRAKVSQTTNAVQEIGFGAPTTTTAIINNGAFFRIKNSGAIFLVTSFNGTEAVSAQVGTLLSTSYYLFLVELTDNGARFIIEDSNGIPLVDQGVPIAVTTPDRAAVSHLPAFVRVYNSGTAGTAPQIIISSFQCWQFGINSNKPWAEQLAGAGRGSNINPISFGQTLQMSATVAPTTGTPVVGSCLYNALGGEYSLTNTASGESTLGVFQFQVPAPYTLHITEVIMQNPFVTTLAGATTPQIQEWSLMVGSTNVPTSSVGQRYPLGMFSWPASAAVGTVANGLPINIDLKTPIVVQPGQYLMVLVKNLSGTTTGVTRGSIFVNGYFE